MERRNGTDGETFADVFEDMALRAMLGSAEMVDGTTGSNVDPLLLMVAQDTAQELLAQYLEHVRLNRAARRVLEQIAGSSYPRNPLRDKAAG